MTAPLVANEAIRPGTRMIVVDPAGFAAAVRALDRAKADGVAFDAIWPAWLDHAAQCFSPIDIARMVLAEQRDDYRRAYETQAAVMGTAS